MLCLFAAGPFIDGLISVEQSVRQDLKFFKDSPYVRKELRENAYGFVYDIKSGELTQISVSGEGRSVL